MSIKIKNTKSRLTAFIHPQTYRHVRYSTRRKRSFSFSGLRIVKDKWCPKDTIVWFDSEGELRIWKLNQNI